MKQKNKRDGKNGDDKTEPGASFIGRGFIILIFIVLLALTIKSMFF